MNKATKLKDLMLIFQPVPLANIIGSGKTSLYNWTNGQDVRSKQHRANIDKLWAKNKAEIAANKEEL